MIVALGFFALATIILVYYTFSPGESNYFPQCSFKALTGYQCVGCGGQRAVHAFLNGNFKAAWRFNALLFFVTPLLAVYVFYALRRFIYRVPAPNNFLYSKSFGLIFITSLLIFLIARNVEW